MVDMEIERLGEITLCVRDDNRSPIAFASLVCYLNQAEIVGLYADPDHREVKGIDYVTIASGDGLIAW